jgi:hypothetical protein
MTDVKAEQCAILKFCYHLKKTAREAYNLLKEAYREEILTQSMAL